MELQTFPPLELAIYIEAHPSRIFEAWTLPRVAEQWLFKNETNSVEMTTDLKVGGKFSIREVDNGDTIDHYGEYLLVEDGHVLEFKLEVPSHFNGVSTVKIELNGVLNGTELILIQSGIDTSVTRDPWINMLNNLKKLVE